MSDKKIANVNIPRVGEEWVMECTLEVSRHEVLGGTEKTTSCKWSGFALLEVVNTMLRMMQEVVSE
ncbi:MAG: hypothetical protein J6S36_03775 [Eggerthellaceae bacterium]|nr:hypothetical protein [Eggerthellaceae bacterium]